MTVTHTYAVLDVDQATFDDIARRLREAGYGHAFDRDVIDMHGIALRAIQPSISPKAIPGIVEDCPCCASGCVGPCSLCNGSGRVSPEAAEAWRTGAIDRAHVLEGRL